MRIKTRNDFPKLFQELGYAQGAEIGVLKGEFSKHILENWDGYLFMVDCWQQQDPDIYFDIANQPNDIQERNFNLAMAVASSYSGRVTVLRYYSTEAAKLLVDEGVMLDWVYFDANHSYESTAQDLKDWYPLIRPGGVVAGHDYLDAENNCGSRFGVKSAVDEFAKEIGAKVIVVPDPWPSWYFFKGEHNG